MPNDFWADDEQTVPHGANASKLPDDDLNGHNAETVARQRPVPAPEPTLVADYNRAYSPPPPPPPPVRGSAARDRMRRRTVRGRRSGGEWAWVVIAVALLSVVIVISMSVTLLLRTSSEPEEIIPTAVAALPTPVDARTDFTDLTTGDGQPITLEGGRSIILQPWNGESRFTMLMMGLDRRPGDDGLAHRTDTMMLVSLDPDTDAIGILSIPRDLFVEVPGYGQLQRVNTPMVLGELQQPGYGPQLAMQTVQYNLGIRVHEYMAVDFEAVISIIDLVGGVDIDVPYDISDPSYPNMWYGYDPLYIRAGMQHMNGEMALKYARTRHSSNDLRRAERQQQVLYALRDKVLDANMLPGLIVQSPALWGQLSDNMYTGLTLDQMIQLAWYLKDVPKDNIRTGVISERYVMPYTTAGGAAVLIPNRAALGPLMVEVFGANYSE
jgi:LCP family protein required for cell wall assembly